MALKGVNQGLAGFAQFGQQQLKNKGQRILNENAQMDLNVKQANQNLALMETFGVVKVNPTTARYELTDNFYEAYQKIPEGERGAIFNGDSLFGAYTDKDGKKKMGELGSAITVEKKVPTSMKDENGDPTEEGKQFLASGQKGIIIPTKREDGMFSFLTRNRSADESDDEGIVLSPAEFGGLMEFRANKLNVLSDANRARAGNLVSQQAENLQGQGMGSSDITVDDQLDMIYNQADSDENIAGTGSQTDVLGGLLEQWKNKIGEERQSILNAQTQNAAPRQGQIGIEFKKEKEATPEGVLTKKLDSLLKEAKIDGAFSISDQESLPVLYDLIQNEGLSLGTSCGVNIAGAIKLAKQMGPGKTIVTILCDHGKRYASKIFNKEFLESKNLPVPKWL